MGSNPTHTLTHRAYLQLVKEAYDHGFDAGVAAQDFITRNDIREEILRELEDELMDNPDCPTCRLRRELKAIEQQFAAVRQELAELKARRRGHAIGHGQRDGRETR